MNLDDEEQMLNMMEFSHYAVVPPNVAQTVIVKANAAKKQES